MKRPWNLIGRGLEWCGAFLLVVISLPLVALSLLLLRGVLLVMAMVGIVSAVTLYCAYPRFHRWVDQHTRRTRPLRLL